jgi:putative membrane protein
MPMTTSLLKLFLGLGLIALILWVQGDPASLWQSISQVGPNVVVVAMICHGLSMSVCGIAWWVTAGRPETVSPGRFITIRWIRDGIGQLLPIIPLAGEIGGARLLAQAGLGGSQAAAVTVVDITAEIMTQAIFSLIGALIWFFQDISTTYALIGIAMSLPMALAMILAQKFGLVRLLERLADRVMPDSWKNEGGSAPIHAAIHSLYENKSRFLASSTIHLSAWILAISESYFVLSMLNTPISLAQALAMESVVFAVRSAAFMVPGALGVQEGGYVLVGAALGIPQEAALAMALIKRARELSLGLPSLLVWQWTGPQKQKQKYP